MVAKTQRPLLRQVVFEAAKAGSSRCYFSQHEMVECEVYCSHAPFAH